MKITHWIGAMALVACGTIAQAQNGDQGGDTSSAASSQAAMKQVDADYKAAKEQCRQAKDKNRCLNEAKDAYHEAKAKVKENGAGKSQR